jgi:hypothetical protein
MVTVPVSGGVVELLLLEEHPPQMRPAANRAAKTAPTATCRKFHKGACTPSWRSLYRAISSRQSMATPATHHPPKRGFRGSAGKFDAEDEAVIVTVAVLLLLRAPTEQVTPASVLATLQDKVTLPEKLLIGVKVSVDVPLVPGFIVKVLGEALSEKSGAAVVKLETLDQVPYTPLEEHKACTCQ